MTNIAKRGLSLLMALVMCISLLSGLVFTSSAATVNYQTGNAEGFQNVIKNWGQRGTNATFLSPNAIEFYEDNNTSYSELSQLSGSSDIDAVTSSALYQELADLMADNHSTITSYADTRDLYRFTDCQNSNNSSISSFYSGVAIGPDWDGGSTWNREHTWPNSKGLNGDDENDIMMLRPTASSENSARGNKAYGESSGYYDPDALSGGTYHLRGDVARTMLYVYVRWGNTSLWGTDGVIENKQILLKWMEEDPVDTWELGRNDSVESITGTRNVFVDYPELVFILFGEEIPTDMVTPSGEAFLSGSAYTITAVSNNDAYGTVSVSGKSVNAAPAEGYIISGYTILSGSAEVTRDGNAFTVVASSDCKIQINFEARVTGTIRYSEDGSVVSSSAIYIGDSITLPAYSGTVADGYTFLGWVTAPVSETTVAPAAVLTAGAAYTVTGDVTFYALFSRMDSSGTGESSVYEAYSGLPVEGDYLIVSDGGALKASVTKSRFDYTDVTITNGAVVSPDADLIWHIAPTADGYFTIYNSDTALYAGGSGTKNQGKLLDTVTDYAKWDISSDLVFENLGNRAKGVNYTLRRNTTYGFACYAATTGTGMTLYKMVTGTVYYSTVTGETCQHINTTDIPEKLPDCTNDGYTAGVYCEDCKSYISGYEKRSALGHSYDAVVTEPTVTDQGYTTYTCSACGDSYVSDYTEALGEQFTVSFKVPSGVASIEAMACGKNGIALPTAGIPSGAYPYTFLGWAAQKVDNSDDKPSYYPAGSTFTADADTVLYALYSYAPEGAGTGAWELLTDVSKLNAGAELVLASNVKGKVAGNISSKYLTSVDAEFSDDLAAITTLPDSAVIFTLGGTEGEWTLSNVSGALLGCTSVKNLAWDSGTITWSIALDEEFNATIQNGTEANGRFLYNVNSPRFLTYTSSTNTSMLLPQLYIRDGAVGTVYYTTIIGDEDVTGVTVGGAVASSSEVEGDVTVELVQDGNVVYSAVASNGSYVIDDVAAGSYTLRVSKASHVTREYEITVDTADVAQDVQICLIGDVNCDGKVNMKDWNRLYDHVNEASVLTDYALLCGDVNGDGKVNMKDWNRLYDHVNEVSPLW